MDLAKRRETGKQEGKLDQIYATRPIPTGSTRFVRRDDSSDRNCSEAGEKIEHRIGDSSHLKKI